MRKHSKFSASGAERWFNCPGSVQLSEGLPDKTTVWAEEGTLAHEILEKILTLAIVTRDALSTVRASIPVTKNVTNEMIDYGMSAANFITGLFNKLSNSDLHVETRIHLDFIHPEMFGTFDAAVIDYFDTLHIFDYKYGAGHSVSPNDNLQMIFYGLGMAHLHHWNFKKIRLWIIQPRIKGYDGPTYWEVSTSYLSQYVKIFKRAVDQVEKYPNKYVEGGHCHWCKAKSICPLKTQAKLENGINIFKANPVDKKVKTDDFY